MITKERLETMSDQERMDEIDRVIDGKKTFSELTADQIECLRNLVHAKRWFNPDIIDKRDPLELLRTIFYHRERLNWWQDEAEKYKALAAWAREIAVPALAKISCIEPAQDWPTDDDLLNAKRIAMDCYAAMPREGEKK